MHTAGEVTHRQSTLNNSVTNLQGSVVSIINKTQNQSTTKHRFHKYHVQILSRQLKNTTNAMTPDQDWRSNLQPSDMSLTIESFELRHHIHELGNIVSPNIINIITVSYNHYLSKTVRGGNPYLHSFANREWNHAG